MCRWRWGGEKGECSLARVKPKVRANWGRRKWGSGGCRAANGYIWAAADAVGHSRYLRKESLLIFYIFCSVLGKVSRHEARGRGRYGPRWRT